MPNKPLKYVPATKKRGLHWTLYRSPFSGALWLEIGMKQLFLFAILTISITSYAEPSKGMLSNFLGLNSSDSSVREKSAYGLKGYYTDNGAEPSQEYLDLLQRNADHLLSTLSDENLQTRYYITELVAARRMSQYPKPSIVFVSLLEDEKIRLFKNKFLNIQSIF